MNSLRDFLANSQSKIDTNLIRNYLLDCGLPLDLGITNKINIISNLIVVLLMSGILDLWKNLHPIGAGGAYRTKAAWSVSSWALPQ